MKYGYLKYVRHNINIGDTIQSFGIKNVYRKMGLRSEDIIEIDKRLMSEYDGEYVVVPIAANCDWWYESKMFPLSPKIIPVFFGFRCVDEGCLRDLEQYREKAIFGCRDAFTMEVLRKNGFTAFVSGCISIQSMDLREKTDKQNKVFLVNAPEAVKQYMPKELLEKSEELTVYFKAEDRNLNEAAEWEEELALERLNLLRERAALVVTPRLHCALPCLAMGIPVIVTLTELGLDNRFMGLNNLLDIYTPDQYSQINWYPQAKDISEIKEKQYNLLVDMLLKTKKEWEPICELSSYFENSEPRAYFYGVSMGYLTRQQQRVFYERKTTETNFLAYVFGRKLYDTHIVIWGAGDKGKWMMDRYKDDILLAKSCIYVDSDTEKHQKKLNGIKILSPEVLKKYPLKDTVIIIATTHSFDKAAQSIARKLTAEYGMLEGQNYFMLDKLNATAQYAISDFGLIKGWQEEKIWL